MNSSKLNYAGLYQSDLRSASNLFRAVREKPTPHWWTTRTMRAAVIRRARKTGRAGAREETHARPSQRQAHLSEGISFPVRRRARVRCDPARKPHVAHRWTAGGDDLVFRSFLLFHI